MFTREKINAFSLFPNIFLLLLLAADMKLVIVDKGQKAKMLIDILDRLPLLRWLIVIDGHSLTDDIRAAAQVANVDVDDFESVLVSCCK